LRKYGKLPTVLDIVLANKTSNHKEPLTLEFVRGLIDLLLLRKSKREMVVLMYLLSLLEEELMLILQ